MHFLECQLEAEEPDVKYKHYVKNGHYYIANQHIYSLVQSKVLFKIFNAFTGTHLQGIIFFRTILFALH